MTPQRDYRQMTLPELEAELQELRDADTKGMNQDERRALMEDIARVGRWYLAVKNDAEEQPRKALTLGRTRKPTPEEKAAQARAELDAFKAAHGWAD